MSDFCLGDLVIGPGESKYIDAECTTRLYNDNGVLRLQNKTESGAWEDQQSWGLTMNVLNEDGRAITNEDGTPLEHE
jgi:hypothetical protein